jgi:membrane fusion protein (multidrug efflux system)
MRSTYASILLLLALVVGGLSGLKALQIRTLMAAAQSMANPPETVSSVIVREGRWQGVLTAIGSITAVQGVTITPEIPGTVKKIAFESGATVAQGDLLVLLDISTEEAQLRSIEAQAELAKINLARAKALRAEHTVSQSELDTAEATLKQTQASADAIKATIEKKTIRAPFTGRLGIRQINLGQYVETGKPIVSLQSPAPVHVDFSLPQQDLARLEKGMRVRLATDAYPGRSFEAVLTAINPDLDAGTRSVGLQATLDNADQALRPGMYARVELLLSEEQQVLVIPATSILSAPYGDLVYVIESKPGKNRGPSELVVRQQFVRTGRARGDFVAVESGLKAGERIVSSGLFKLRNGMAVIENNNLSPKSEEEPKPAEG